jgi:hypothetical protein
VTPRRRGPKMPSCGPSPASARHHPTDFPELWRLLDDQGPEVRSAAAGLIEALGRGRKEVEEQAERSPPPGAGPSGTSGGTATSMPAAAATDRSRRQARKAKP